MMKKKEPAASGTKDAAQDVINAVSSKDAAALDLALKRHYALCSHDDEDEAADGEDY